MLPLLRLSHVLLVLMVALGPGTATSSGAAPRVSEASPAIVIGFVGGFVRHDDTIHNEVRLAAKLRQDFPSGVTVKIFENHRGKQARQEILRLLDADQDGKLSAEEKRNARIIIYGHSWGASETVNLARELEKENIPVLLTIQVDSISKGGRNDEVIPANVAQAANFYQADGLLHGTKKIRSADPARTRIIGNFLADYKAHPVRCAGYPWFSRVFMRTHIEIECDPEVWNQVDSLIRSNLPAPEPDGSSPRIDTVNSPAPTSSHRD